MLLRSNGFRVYTKDGVRGNCQGNCKVTTDAIRCQLAVQILRLPTGTIALKGGVFCAMTRHCDMQDMSRPSDYRVGASGHPSRQFVKSGSSNIPRTAYSVAQLCLKGIGIKGKHIPNQAAGLLLLTEESRYIISVTDMSKPSDLIQGTLNLLILKILALEPMHGWAIGQRLRQASSDTLQVSDGSLYPALHKLEQDGWIRSEWKASENNRRAKFYSLTRPGRKYLEQETANWDRLSNAISGVLRLKGI